MEENDKKFNEFMDLFNEISSSDKEDTDSFSQEEFEEENSKIVSEKLSSCDKSFAIKNEMEENNKNETNEHQETLLKMCTNLKDNAIVENNKEDIKVKIEVDAEDVSFENNKISHEPSKEQEQEDKGEEIEKDAKLLEGNKLVIIDGKIKWMLDSPVPMYDKFYEKKKELIEITENNLGGQIDFKSLNEELKNSHVSAVDQVFDKEIVREKMEQVQQYRERLKDITLTCNMQYFVWGRWIDNDLLKGYLARIEYLKPSIKQEGLVLEHMRDLEYYYSQLQTLYNNCQKVEKTLEAAFDMLSRKVSICMELKSGDRYEKKPDQIGQNIKRSDLSEYDEVPMGETAVSTKNKNIHTGKIDW